MLPVFLDYLFLIAPSSCVLCTQCCQCFWIIYSWLLLRPVSCVPTVDSVSGLSILDCSFVLCLVYPLLTVFLDYLFLIAPSSSVLCTHCWQCFWIIYSWLLLRPVSCVPTVDSVSGLSILDCSFVLCLMYPLLTVFLDYLFLIAPSSCVLCTHCGQCFWIICSWLPLRPVSCVPTVDSVSGLSILDCSFVLCLVYPMLPVFLDYLFLIAPSSCVLCTQCCQCFWIIYSLLLLRPVSCVSNVTSVSRLSILDCSFVLCLMYPMLPVFLDYLFLIAPSSCVLCTQCCQCFWIIYSWLLLRPVSYVSNVASDSGLSIFDCSFVLCLVYPMLPVFLDYLFLIAPSYRVLCIQCCQCFGIIYSWLLLRPVSCVPNVASVSGLSILDCSFVLCLVYPMLPVFLDYLFLIAPSSCVLCTQCCQCFWIIFSWLLLRPVSCVPNVASVSGLSILDCSFVLCLVYPMLPVFLDYLFLIAPSSCVLCIQCCQCFWIIYSWLLLRPVSYVPNVASVSGLSILDCSFVLCLMYPMLPVFLDYLFLIAPSSCVLCTQCCQCFWIIYSWLLLRPVSCVPNAASVSGLSILDCSFVLCLMYPMLPVFLDYLFLIAPSFCVLCTQCCQCFWIIYSWLLLRPVSCVPNVASVSGLSILDCSFVLCLVYPMLPVFLDYLFLIAPSSCVLCTQCCQCFWIIYSWLLLRPVSCVPNVDSVSGLSILDCSFILCLVYPMLPVFLDYLFLIAPSSCVLCTQCCQCFWIIYSWLLLRPVSCVPNVASVSGLSILDCSFVLCLVYLMLPVFLDYLFLIAPSSCVLCTQCWQCFWIIYSWLLLRPVSCVPNVASVSGLSILDCSFVLCLVYQMLPVFLDYLFLIAPSSCVLCTHCWQCFWIIYSWLLLRPVSCVANVASVSGLSILDCSFVLCLMYPMLPVFLDYLFLIAPSSCVLCTHCWQCFWIIYSWLLLRPVSCVPTVDSVSRLSILDCSFVLCLVYPLLTVLLDYLFLIAPSSCVLCTHCWQCFWIIYSWLLLRPLSYVPTVDSVSGLSILDCSFVLCLVYPLWTVFLDYLFLIAPSSCVLCTHCWQCLWIIYSWLLLRPVSCVSNVASVSRLSILDCSFVLCLMYPMLPVFLDYLFLIAPSSCVLCIQCYQCF